MRRWVTAAALGAIVFAGAVWSQGPTPAQWIWRDEGTPGLEAPAGARFFLKDFSLSEKPGSAKLRITADNRFRVWVNDVLIGDGDDWAVLHEFDVKALKVGENRIAVEGTNEGGPAGLVAWLEGKAGGKAFRVATDATWKASTDGPAGWRSADAKGPRWTAARVLGAYGKTAPWNGGGGAAPVAKSPKERFTLPPGFVIEPVVPTSAKWPGMPENRHVSFVNCCFDAKGRLLLSQEQGPILRLGAKSAEGLHDELPVYCDLVKNCQGMCWADDALYLVGDGPKGTGLYRCRDLKGADKIDEAVLLHKFKGGMGEHGPHGVIHGPDGWLYVVVGNHAFVQIGAAAPKDAPNPTALARNSPVRRWPTGLMGPDQGQPGSTEDTLIPRLNDANGHAANILAPGGTIWRFDRNGQNPGLVSAGYRNQYDAAFNPAGELFSFDSDMEWDIGLPWYRPVRIVHAPMGSDFGWRTGAANQQGYLFDSLPPLHDTGRGSPVGVECYDGRAFPPEYRGMILCCDWSIGVVYSVHPKREGSRYVAEVKRFVEGRPMNVTDAAVGPDDAVYLTLGGRNGRGEVYRVRAAVEPKALPALPLDQLLAASQPLAPYRRAEFKAYVDAGGPALANELRAAAKSRILDAHARTRALDALHLYVADGPGAELLVALTTDASPEVRGHAVQLLGTRAPKEAAAALVTALGDRDPWVQRRACEALVRADVEPPVDKLVPLLGSQDRFVRFAARSVLERIDDAKWAGRLLDHQKASTYQGLDAIVALCRRGTAEKHAEAIFQWFDDAERPNLDADLLDVVRAMQLALFHVKARPASLKNVAKEWTPLFPHPDARISREVAVVLAQFQRDKLSDDAFQGRLLQRMLAKGTEREDQIHYAYCLRLVPDGWNAEQAQALHGWFESTRTWSGGNSFAGFLQNIFKDVAKRFSAETRTALVAEGKSAPWATATLLAATPTNELPPPAGLAELHASLADVAGQPKVSELKDQIVAALVRHGKEEAFAAARAIAEKDASALESVARALVKFPTNENWPTLVRGLDAKSPVVVSELIRTLQKSKRKPTLSTPPKDDEGAPFRALILAGGRLPEKDRWPTALLLRHWGGKSFALEDGDWKAEVEGWAKWYGQTFPKAAPLPGVAALTSTSKWKMADLVQYLDGDGKTGDVARGRKVFEKAACVKCHKFGSIGEGMGPDLTNLKARFKRVDVLESVLFPSKVVSDQYRGSTLVLQSGQVVNGLAAAQGDTITVLQLDGAKVTLRRADVAQQAASTLSPMPERLFDELTREEIADLFAFLESAPR